MPRKISQRKISNGRKICLLELGKELVEANFIVISKFNQIENDGQPLFPLSYWKFLKKNNK